MRAYKFLLLVFSIVLLTGCSSTRKSLTGDEFYQTLTKYEYSVKDSISAYDYALSAYNAYKGDISVFFLKGKKKYDVEGIFISESQNLFTEVGDNYQKKLGSGKNWTSLRLTTDEKLYYISWIDDSYIIIKAKKSDETNVNKLIDELGY